MTTWSGADPNTGHLKIGINVTTSDGTPSYGESITISVTYYVQTVNWSYSDNVTLNWQAFGLSGSVSIALDLAANQSKAFLTKTHTYTAGASSIPVSAGGSVSGVYDGANPSLSNTTRYTIPAAPGTPNAPATPSAGTVTATSQVVNWTAPGTNGSAITGYMLAYRVHPSGSWNYITLGNVLTRTVTGLTPGTNYDYEVKANSGAGYGPYSGALNVSTLVTVPADPTAITVADASTPTTPGIAGTWTAGATNGSTGDAFDVYVNTTGTLGTPSRYTSGVASGGVGRQYDNGSALAPIAANTTYYAWVRVKWTTPAGSPSATWVSLGSVTTAISGGSGSLVARIRAAIQRIASDIANPTCYVYSTTTQSIGFNPASTTISWTNANINTGTTPMWSSGTNITIQKAGKYDICAQLTMGGTTWTAGKYFQPAIQVNGSTIAFNIVYPPGVATGVVPCQVEAPAVQLAAGDVVTLIGTQTLVNSTFQYSATATATWMSVSRTGP